MAEDQDKPGQPLKRQLAVALSFRPETPDDAPKVVASGRGKAAEQILELAFAKGIRVREDPDLAEILAAVDINSVIPLSAFIAVAEILSFVYRSNNQPIPQPSSAAMPEGAP